MVSKGSLGNWDDVLPVPFNYGIYVGHPESQDLAVLDEGEALRHYEDYGRTEGRACSEIKSRMDFIGLPPPGASILEIGPFFSPAFRRPEANVSYLDCLSSEAMKTRAAALGNEVVDTVPEIDYVWTGQRYSELVDRKFSVVYSSHNIEHQPCLVTHLRDLESVLEQDGVVFLVVPDKRYCFDHFFPETGLPEVIEAWVEQKKKHRLSDILDHLFFTAHNDPVRHWLGDHGANRNLLPLEGERHVSFLAEVERYRATDEYTDVHAWKFTPASFRVLFENLFNLKLTKLRVLRVYPTVKNSNEFYAVLVPGCA